MKTRTDKDALLAFVDEIGDRGLSKKSSEYFAMAAIIFPLSRQQNVKDCIVKMKKTLQIQLKTPFHWREHCHRHDVRKMERVLNHTEELNAKVTVRFGHVRGFDHSTTLDYFKNRNWRYCNYDSLINEPKWISADTNSGIQMADLYAGILGAAMIPDRFGNYEPSYLETIRHQIRKSNSGKISGYGIKAITWENNPQVFKWWPKGWE